MDKELRIELGHAWMPAEEASRLDVGGRIVLDAPPESAWGIYVDGRRIASGSPAVMDGMFCVRVLDVAAGRVPPARPAGQTAPAGG